MIEYPFKLSGLYRLIGWVLRVYDYGRGFDSQQLHNFKSRLDI
jgi:hypothetical protein